MSVASADEMLGQISDLTRELQSLSKAGDWDAVVALEGQRQELIESCFREGARFADPQRARQVIETVLGADRAVMDNVCRAKDGLTQELSDLRRSRSANDAYKRFSE